jgi:lipopolysaccharide transport system permease protein
MNAAALRYYRDLLFVLVAKDLKVRYKSTFLGYAWSPLHPLAFAVVFFFVFRIIIQFEVENFALFLIAGLFPWHCLSNSLVASNAFFLGNGPPIKKVRFPRALLVLAGVLNDAVHSAISIPVILLFMLCCRVYPSPCWLWGVPLLFAVQLLLTYGLSLLLASLNLFFRDLERLTVILVLLLFYLTPVICPEGMVPEQFRWMLYANPMAPVTVAWRGLFLEGSLRLGFCAVALVTALLVLVVGHLVCRKLEWRFAEVV